MASVRVSLQAPGMKTEFSITAEEGTRIMEERAQQRALRKTVNVVGESSKAAREDGPGTDPKSRFAYVYTGRHDHGNMPTLKQSSGVSEAIEVARLRCDELLTQAIEQSK